MCHVINLIVKKLVSKTMGEALESEGPESLEAVDEYEFESNTFRTI